MWTDMTLRLVRLPKLEMIEKVSLGEVIPRSVLLKTMEGIHYVLCGLGDGHLITFTLNPVNGALADRRKVSLGTQPIILNPFKTAASSHVFAASDRPTVIYSSNKKLLFSNVNLKANQFKPKRIEISF
jgi:DNA damage-binding protein 1